MRPLHPSDAPPHLRFLKPQVFLSRDDSKLMPRKPKRHRLPIPLLIEAYRPLAFFLGEAVLSAGPFLPALTQKWALLLLRAADNDDILGS